jgi:hypothetical protein
MNLLMNLLTTDTVAEIKSVYDSKMYNHDQCNNGCLSYLVD